MTIVSSFDSTYANQTIQLHHVAKALNSIQKKIG